METTRIQDLATDPRQHQPTEHVRWSEHSPPADRPPPSELPPPADDSEVSLWEGFIPDPVGPGELELDGPSAAGDLAAGS